MKKLLGLLIVPALLFASCASTSYSKFDYAYPQSGNINNAAPIPVKDYETLGIIFVESTEVIDGNGIHTGSKITHALLMREAEKLGADDVINLRIDVQEIKEFVSVSGNNLGGKALQTTYKYTATALAIKYTDVIVTAEGIPYFQRGGGSYSSPGLEAAPESKAALEPEESLAAQRKAQKSQPKRMYLGGFFGGGFTKWKKKKELRQYYWHEDKDDGTNGMATGGVVFNYIPLRLAFSDIFAFNLGVEAMAGATFDTEEKKVYPVVPLQATVGADIGPVGFSMNAGYAIVIGFAAGATLDCKIGSGKLYLQYLAIPSINEAVTGVDKARVHMWFLGYKFGLGKSL
jgi:hypothetical protein